jgi:hypothetical protein
MQLNRAGKRVRLGWLGYRNASYVAVVAGLVLSIFSPVGSTATASGYAVVEGSPVASATPGLPDGRVYEMVSPADKHGNEAGSGTAPFETGGRNQFGVASADGDAVLFEGTGPMGESPWGNSLWFVATKNVGNHGWSTRALLPRQVQNLSLLSTKNYYYIDPSPDLSHAAVEPIEGSLVALPNEECGYRMYLAGPDPFIEPAWLEQPGAGLASPVEVCAAGGASGTPVGGNADFSTVYFTYPGTLLPEDASRAPHATGEAWGLYEYSEGVLHEAGILPDGSLSPFGAVPAASSHGRNREGNEVSSDGSRLFFVSPDPASCEQNNDCATDPPELYVHESGTRTVLVSKDTLLPEVGGLEAAAPTGVLPMSNPSNQISGELSSSYVFASPDGSQAFFKSGDPLTPLAAETSPGTEPKTYDLDVTTGTLTYLPGVQGEIIAVDSDGSALAFIRPEDGGEPAQLEMWVASATGGAIIPVAQLPEPAGTVPEARMSDEGSVLVFQTAERLSPSFNASGEEEIYRYDLATNSLGCISCAPRGVAPRGNATMSALYRDESEGGHEGTPVPVDERGISSDGDRVFFETPTPLVPEDSNTNSPEQRISETGYGPQGRDVYEWENGVVYLISTGQSTRNSYLLGSSENGNDVFFATAQSLVPEDTDGGYDVYDARVPRPEDTPAPPATPCEGSSCQATASAPAAPAISTSASFSGLGNVVPEAMASKSASPTPTPAKKCKKGYVKKKGRCVKHRSKKTTKAASKPLTLGRAFITGAILGTLVTAFAVTLTHEGSATR